MEEIHVKRLEALKRCSFCPATSHKRFVRDTRPDMDLSDRQKHYIDILAWRFRRQMPQSLVPSVKPDDLPPKPKSPKKEKPLIENNQENLL